MTSHEILISIVIVHYKVPDFLQRALRSLRQAQLSLQHERAWSSPYYWAAFTLQGEWR